MLTSTLGQTDQLAIARTRLAELQCELATAREHLAKAEAAEATARAAGRLGGVENVTSWRQRVSLVGCAGPLQRTLRRRFAHRSAVAGYRAPTALPAACLHPA